VVDTTWLDRIGIPVYSSIRADGAKGTLCAHAGKGFTHAEAKIGAYMETFEFSFAPPGRNVVDRSLRKPDEILASFKNRIGFADLCVERFKLLTRDTTGIRIRVSESLDRV
jgi:ribosomal protein S12 methylthiotransferase accessory factor